MLRYGSEFWLEQTQLPDQVRNLSNASNRPVMDPTKLFFRNDIPGMLLPEVTIRGKFDSWGPFALDARTFYLLQGDGSLAVYSYLFDGSHSAGVGWGCVYVGCIHSKDWTAGNTE
jgi:hypothetical protein